jgi:hypothetical protein|tara:strand:- start:2075 stop:2362 length:288 start_codon:yes stop_codon:yes gene_type:complete
MVKQKKATFRTTIINKKKYYFYTIKWQDILGSSGWSHSEELIKFEPSIMISQAYVFLKNKKKLVTFASYDTQEESFADCNAYPMGCIISMEKIKL